jgi:pantoate--beta-alanine ligase
MNEQERMFSGPRVLESIAAFREWRAGIDGSLGLVPTMGALHDGHLALVRQARAENQHVAVTIFVNPRQFEPDEDFERYPRTLEQDLAALRAENVDAVFVPDVSEMYPPGSTTEIHVRGLSERLEGESRPGHFAGVALVVNKLFNVCQPHRAYFGQKDAQQVLVVQKMVTDLDMPIDIVPVETVRDPDGLAISSRNVFLSPAERQAARRIPTALFQARKMFDAGERSADRIRDFVREELNAEPLLRMEYVSVADAETLEELSTIDRLVLLSLAVSCGETRLIDNVVLECES